MCTFELIPIPCIQSIHCSGPQLLQATIENQNARKRASAGASRSLFYVEIAATVYGISGGHASVSTMKMLGL